MLAVRKIAPPPLVCMIASGNVFLNRYRLKMVRIYTTPNSAKMIKHKAVRNAALSNLIRNAVSVLVDTLYRHPAIAVLANSTVPDPAVAAGDPFNVFGKLFLDDCHRIDS